MSIPAGDTRLIHEFSKGLNNIQKGESHEARSIIHRPARRAHDLKQIVEPLANYICAAQQPKQALLSVVAALRHEVELTNRMALSHFRSYSEN